MFPCLKCSSHLVNLMDSYLSFKTPLKDLHLRSLLFLSKCDQVTLLFTHLQT